jgi:hypothetical protein
VKNLRHIAAWRVTPAGSRADRPRPAVQRGGPHRPRGRARRRRGGGALDGAVDGVRLRPGQIRMERPRCVAGRRRRPVRRACRAEHAHRGLPSAPAHGRVPLAPGARLRGGGGRDSARVRGPLRPRRRGRVSLVRAHERDPRPGRGRGRPLDRDPAARAGIQPGGGSRHRGGRAGGPRDPRGRRPGRGRFRLRHAYGARGGQDRRPRQRLRRGGQAAGPRARGHRSRSGPERGRHPRGRDCGCRLGRGRPSRPGRTRQRRRDGRADHDLEGAGRGDGAPRGPGREQRRESRRRPPGAGPSRRHRDRGQSPRLTRSSRP